MYSLYWPKTCRLPNDRPFNPQLAALGFHDGQDCLGVYSYNCSYHSRKVSRLQLVFVSSPFVTCDLPNA